LTGFIHANDFGNIQLHLILRCRSYRDLFVGCLLFHFVISSRPDWPRDDSGGEAGEMSSPKLADCSKACRSRLTSEINRHLARKHCTVRDDFQEPLERGMNTESSYAVGCVSGRLLRHHKNFSGIALILDEYEVVRRYFK